jgi:hypothetical protein
MFAHHSSLETPFSALMAHDRGLVQSAKKKSTDF